MPRAYRVQLVCRHLDFAKWIVTDDPYLSLTAILDSRFAFNCPVHGPQYEKPLQAEEKRDGPVENVRCSVDGCASRPIDVLNHRPFCQDHFIHTCQGQLATYNQWLKEQHWRELSFEVVEQFIYDCMRGADRIEHGDRGLDDFQRAQLLNIVLSAAELGRHLRRSPRKALAIPLRLISEKLQDSWEEDTETIVVSRCGALVRSHHSVQIDQQLRVLRNDEEQLARARVAWCPRERDARPVVAIEFLDHDNFWGMDWTASKAKR
jgi:hypothetical protein